MINLDTTEILEITDRDLGEIKIFSDQWIGPNYYNLQDLQKILKFSKIDNLNASFLVRNKLGKIVAIRLTYAPGDWAQDARGITPKLWSVPQNRTAYFKSLFVHKSYQQLGLGHKLSNASINVLKKMGTEAIVCHSWLESPGNSSQKYLEKMGFSKVFEHQKFWNPIDYDCPRCSPNRCECTAIEMIKYLKEDL